ncbi:MAG: hypothetical protein ABWK00_01990 [Desulfurococcaceae archaeon]
MRGLGEILSVVVIFAAILAASLAIYLASLRYSETSVASAEYGEAKNVLVDLAARLPQLAAGGSLQYSYLHSLASIGFQQYGTITIDVTFSNGSTTSLTLRTTALVARVRGNLVPPGQHIVFGCGPPAVDNPAGVPCVWENYSDGWTYAVLETARAYYRAYSLNYSGVLQQFVDIIVFNFSGPGGGSPLAYGQGVLRASLDPSRDVALLKYLENVSKVVIVTPGGLARLDGTTAPQLNWGAVTLRVYIYQVEVVIG